MKNTKVETLYEKSLKNRSHIETVRLKRKGEKPEDDMRMHKVIKVLQGILFAIVIGAIVLLLLHHDTQNMFKQLLLHITQ